MSDSVTNVEIEDVLSSIRRLVSDGDRTQKRETTAVAPTGEADSAPAANTSESEQPAASTDRLLLTPAFLVVEGEQQPTKTDLVFTDEEPPVADDLHPEEDQLEDATAAPEDGEAEAVENQAADGAVALDVTEAATGQGADDVAEDWQEEPWPEPEATSSESSDAESSDAESSDAQIPLTDLGWKPVEAPDIAGMAAETIVQETTGGAQRADLVSTIAELEAAIGKGGGEYEPDGSEVAKQAIDWPDAPVATQQAMPDAPEADKAEAEKAEGEADGSEKMSALDKISNVAPLRAEQPAPQEIEFEPEPVLTFEHRDTNTHRLANSVEAAPPLSPVFEDEADDLEGILEAGGIELDEEALREMVADVVREELAGPLGERITRNVRKLVRREIYRILSSQEFD